MSGNYASGADVPGWVQHLFQRFQAAESDQIRWVSIWRDLARHIRPVNESIGQDKDYRSHPTSSLYDDLFDTTGVQSNLIYAAGCLSWLSPAEAPWFKFDPPRGHEENDNVKSWLSICNQEVARALANSNFYGAIHEAYLDDGAFGTCAIHVPEPTNGKLHFEVWGIGDYYALQDKEGRVDTVFRRYKLTARQAAQKFGEEKLPEDLREELTNGKGDRHDAQHEFLHVIMPRKDRKPRKIDAVNMPFASYHFFVKDKSPMAESGFWEMPVMVHRHLTWEDSVYGWAPAFFALPECRQLNDLQMNLDLLVEIMVDPRTLVPASLEGEVDLRAGGTTLFSDPNQIPREWGTVSDYPSGKDRAYDKASRIRQAFHVDLFQALASVPPGTEMTATEILARQKDRLTLFSPTFSRKVTELHTPILHRVFALMLRAGAFPDPPQELVLYDQGGAYLPDPDITFTSRLALALDAIQTEGFDRTLARVLPIAQAFPDILDNFEIDHAMRDIARAEGMKEEWIRPKQDVDQIRGEKARQMQEENLREDMLEEVDAAAKLGLAGGKGEPQRMTE